MFTNVLTQSDCRTLIRDNADRFRAIASGQEFLTDDHLRRIVSSLRSPQAQVLAKIMLDPVQRAEKRCAFASGPALRALLRHVEKVLRLERLEQLRYLKDSRSEVDEACSAMLSRARIPTHQESDELLTRFMPNPVTRGLVSAIVEQGGLDGRYTLEVGKSDSPVIESTLGYNFALSSPLDNMGEWRRSDVKVIVIDGVIEGVHEIHHALDAASRMKFPLMICARGFGDDVVMTLRVNRSRGTVDCLPLAMPVEVDTLNTPKDVAIVCGSDLISTAKGDLISSIRLENAPTVSEVSYRPGQLIVTNKSTEHAVAIHVKQLSESRHVSGPETRALYEARLKSLSPNHTMVKLPRTYDSLSVRSEAQMVGNGLRLIRAMHESGVYDTQDGIDIPLRTVIAERFVVAQLPVLVGTECALIQEP